MGLGRHALKGISWGVIGAGLGGLLQLVQLAWLARLLGAEEFGLAAMAAIPLGLATVFADAGVGNLLVVRHDLSREEQSSLYWFNCLSSFAIALALFLLAPAIALLLGDPRATSLVQWSALTFLIMPLGQQFQFLLQKDLRFSALTGSELLSQAAAAVATVALAAAGYGALAVVWGAILGVAVRSLAWAALGWRRWAPLAHFAWADLRDHLGFSGYQLGERLINFTSRNLDKMLISSLLGAAALGHYNIAYQLVQKPLAMLQPIVSRVALPLFARMDQGPAQLNRAYLLVVRALALAFFPLFGLVALFPGDVIALMLGERWLPAASLLTWLALLHCFFAIGPAIGPYLLALKRADQAFWMNVIALLLYAGAVLMGARHGAEGIAIGLFVATACGLFPIGSWVRWRLTALSPLDNLSSLAPALVATASAGLVATLLLLLPPLVDAQALPRLIAAGLCGTGVYALVLLLAFRPALNEIATVLGLKSATPT